MTSRAFRTIAADVPVGAQVADVRLELTPLAEPVLQAEHELVRVWPFAQASSSASRSSAWTKRANPGPSTSASRQPSISVTDPLT